MQADELREGVQAIIKEEVRESWARWRKEDDLPNQSLRWEGHDAAFAMNMSGKNIKGCDFGLVWRRKHGPFLVNCMTAVSQCAGAGKCKYDYTEREVFHDDLLFECF